ncbi:hypothetical protein J3Q64DRAFT_1700150 [Phycomyces blakesleeanus]|uniref:Uncharacterized protein n=2 Tax=Phycomyces blakesleeanus TaxID=4837 RepID=A0A162PGU5_PHYB8|nr:hypothetical protein PHYBLDRAFT_74168 [Phycomyces blakesleeanus NRRL 1555(-)]OAD72697.1 hypothetical protein PHYBLDRAFT_74168 [Phycomyces blakesleeanus NRRL 1555(-)]|eukprot:XP_018290737.1 hypothetical protein PHYBLDRAFT_74168 [Phycomyces blakesleeanus NRRL 1555(-)]
MRLYQLLTRTIKVYKYNCLLWVFKVVILGAMSNIPDILLIFPLVSDVFNRTGIFKQATHHWFFERNNICIALLNSNNMKNDEKSDLKYIIVSLDCKPRSILFS